MGAAAPLEGPPGRTFPTGKGLQQASHTRVGPRWGAQQQVHGLGALQAPGGLTFRPRDSRGVRAGLVCTAAIHVQRNLFPFAAAVVGVQGVDGHLKLYLETPSTHSYEDPKALSPGTPPITPRPPPNPSPCQPWPSPGAPRLQSTPQATNSNCNGKGQSGFLGGREGGM